MGKHASHKIPTCKRCGTEHYNMRPCPAPTRPELGSRLEVIHRADSGVRSLDMSRTSIAATGAFVGGSRIDKHPARRMAATAGENA